jgi:hypothetical protein
VLEIDTTGLGTGGGAGQTGDMVFRGMRLNNKVRSKQGPGGIAIGYLQWLLGGQGVFPSRRSP